MIKVNGIIVYATYLPATDSRDQSYQIKMEISEEQGRMLLGATDERTRLPYAPVVKTDSDGNFYINAKTKFEPSTKDKLDEFTDLVGADCDIIVSPYIYTKGHASGTALNLVGFKVNQFHVRDIKTASQTALDMLYE